VAASTYLFLVGFVLLFGIRQQTHGLCFAAAGLIIIEAEIPQGCQEVSID